MYQLHEIGVSDKNGTHLKLNDNVRLFGQTGVITYECGSYGIAFQDCIDWNTITNNVEQVTSKRNAAMFCYNDNFISLWELIWNFNDDEDICSVIEIIT